LETKASGTTSVSATTPAEVVTDKFYTFSVYGKSPDADQEISLTITATDTVTSTVLATETTTATLVDIWTRASVTTFVPLSTNPVEITVDIQVEDSGEIIYFDSAQVEASSVATDYIDGSMPTSYYTGWAGTANDSVSHQYLNKEVRIARLTSEIEKYLPATTSYRILTLDGVEAAKITY
jgi:hypothetical protein